MSDIDFTDYDRISDILMYLGESIVLSFVVTLSKKTPTGERRFFHYETQSSSDKFGNSLRNIKRTMNYYYVLEDKNNFGSGVILRPQEVMALKMLLQNEVLPWFLSEDKNVYTMNDKELRLKTYKPALFTTSYGKGIQFNPIIYKHEDGLSSMGVQVILVNTNTSAEIPLDKFLGFVHIITETDMYSVACSNCTYAKTQPYGLNTYSVSGGLGAARETSYPRENSYSKGFSSNSFLSNK